MSVGPRVVVVLFVALAACTPAAPASPTFADDVGPILAAHCARCHGFDGALRSDYTTPGKVPRLCHLDAYEDRGDCGGLDASVTGTPCRYGAHTCAGLLKDGTIFATMPPRLSDRLNDWEQTMIVRWAASPLP